MVFEPDFFSKGPKTQKEIITHLYEKTLEERPCLATDERFSLDNWKKRQAEQQAVCDTRILHYSMSYFFLIQRELLLARLGARLPGLLG